MGESRPAVQPGRARRVARAIVNLPGAGLVYVPTRTAGFAVGSYLRTRFRSGDGYPPAPRPSLTLTAQVALDEAFLGWMKSPRRFPADADYESVRAELHAALALYRKRGFLAHPETYHRAPPVPDPVVRRGWASGLRYERLAWPSAYRPHRGEPGRERWLGYEANRTAHAMVLRGDPGAPWLVCVHGFGTGIPVADFFAFHARHLREALGLNLLFPVLPLHGLRRASRLGGTELMSYQLHNFTLGMSQSMSDIRALLGWARGQGAERIGVYGMSLGAYAAALLVTLDPGLDLVIAGAPLSDVPGLFQHHSTRSLRRKVDPEGVLADVGRQVHTVISPLVRPPLVPVERRFLFAGLGDRMSPPAQAHRLWEHWEKPQVSWYEGSHISFLWSPAVGRFVDDALRESGFVSGAPVAHTPRPPRRAAPAAGTRGPGPRPARS